ncbi:hypothetical protein DYI37_08000 [Fulvimarina endophytica]|uniref:Uncharacterized protein n=1 Tax=Fulvimarina endophytica TaxID=2293836 RepID=A0A371X4W8_9HYPH|nr:hypothetical protein [Fulvimarina endophytica]RFC64272.1 hypothetical protein DYI37_08000 [Fulvimarina endophytica]
MRPRPSSRGEGDDFNPIVDLVLSILAVSILLLALVGRDGAMRIGELEARIGAVRPPEAGIPVPPPAPGRSSADPANPALDAEEPAEAILARTRYHRAVLGTSPPRSADGFLAAGRIEDEVIPEIRTVLGRDLAGGESLLEAMQANGLVIEVDTAARPRQTLSDAWRESVAVAERLRAGLTASPLPLACIAIVPFGPERSSLVSALSRRGGPEGNAPPLAGAQLGPVATPALGSLLSGQSGETTIRIVAEATLLDTSLCDHESLRRAIVDWIAAD